MNSALSCFSFLSICLILISFPGRITASELDPEEPWSISEKNPVFDENLSPSSKDFVLTEQGLLTKILNWTVKFFQRVISPVDGDRCSMYPTCSAYSRAALKKHGAIIGGLLTVDRLIHELEEQESVPIILKYGEYRFYDPVENNDFWWQETK